MTPMRSILLLLLAATPAAADPLRVRLPDTASAPGSLVALRDVAELSGDPAAVAVAGALDVAELPKDGTGTLTRRQVEFRLRLAGVPAFEVTGADRVTISVRRRTISADEVVAVAVSTLAKRLPWPIDEQSIELVQPVAAKLPDLAVGDASVTAEPNTPNPTGGRVQMNVTISAAGVRKQAVAVYLDAKRFQTVAVLTAAVPANEPIPADKLRGERRAVDPSKPALTPEDAAGRKATRALPAGHVLLATDTTGATANAPLVKPGQRVTLSVLVGSLSVTATGEALQGGRLGDPVRVRNVDSNKVVHGTVSGPGTVTVEPGGGT